MPGHWDPPQEWWDSMEVGTRTDHTNTEYNEFWENENYLIDVVSRFTDDREDPAIRQEAFAEFKYYMEHHGLDLSQLDWEAWREAYKNAH